MSFGLGGFYTQAINKDFSRNFQMRVLSLGGILEESDNVYITTAVLPGYMINNQQVPYMGVNFNVPGTASFPGSESWQVSFRCDLNLNIREKLVNWQSSIFSAFPGETRNTGAYGPVSDSSIGKLVVHDRDGNTARAIKLFGIYPVTVGDIAYDQTGNGQPVTVDVTLAYQWWEPADFKISLGN